MKNNAQQKNAPGMQVRAATVVSWLISLSLLLSAQSALADYEFAKVADTSAASGFEFVWNPSINASGSVAFMGEFVDGRYAILLADGGDITPLAFGDDITGNIPRINNDGLVAYIRDQYSIHTTGGTTIAEAGEGFLRFDGVLAGIHTNGHVGFFAQLIDGGHGIFVSDGDSLMRIADTNGPFDHIQQTIAMSPSGNLAFWGELDDGTGGLYRFSNGVTTQIAGDGTPVSGAFRGFDVNDSGLVVFKGDAHQGFGGVFLGDGETISMIVDLTTYREVYDPAINASGQIAFWGEMRNGLHGIFTGSDPVSDKVIQIGDPIFGETVTDVGSVFDINDSGDIAFSYSFGSDRTGIAVARIIPGTSQHKPILPDSDENGVYVYERAESGMWFDPPLASSILYEMTTDSVFTGIVGFPTGFAQPFTVSVDGLELGTFQPGDSVDFSGFESGGVEQFTVSGITPLVDAEDPLAFPLRLTFSTPMAGFQMRFVPEPSGTVLLTLSTVSFPFLTRRRSRLLA